MSTSLPTSRRPEVDRLQWGALAVGAVALGACAAGALSDPGQFFRAYLAAYTFYLGLGLGSLVIVMVYHLTGGAWGFLIRRALEAAMRTLPLLALLFVPVACGLAHLYVWARPEAVEASKNLQHKQVYLNEAFFRARAALFFVAWSALAYWLSAWSRAQDRGGDGRLLGRFGRLSGAGLVVYGVTVTFASVDWVMSLQPTFRSTIFGPLFASGQLLSAHAFAILVAAWLLARPPGEGPLSPKAAERPPLADYLSVEALNDLGNLLLTFLVIWAYMVFFQFMLIWIANLPYEVVWYLPRASVGWRWVAWALFLFHFAVPFFLLLMRDVKRDPRSLAQVAGLVLFMQLVFDYYQVLPAFPDTQLAEHWMDFLTPLGVGGLWLADFLWELKRYPLLPRHDSNEASATHLRELDLETAAREQEAHHA